MSVYSVRRLTPSTYRFVKFDELFNPVSTYNVVERSHYIMCDCPQSNRHSCRHREMLPVFQRSRAVDTGKFYDFERQKWLPPIRGG